MRSSLLGRAGSFRGVPDASRGEGADGRRVAEQPPRRDLAFGRCLAATLAAGNPAEPPGGVGEEFRIVENGENPSYDKLLVFPRSSLRTLGPIRSGSLARDASLGLSPVETMDELLVRLGEINDFPTADGILLLGANGNILGNVLVKDWLENLNILVSGINDILLELRGYGSSTTEWNVEQVAVVQQKIEQHLAGLKMFISRQRVENKAAIANLKFEPQSHMIGDVLAHQTACCRPRTQPLCVAHLIAVLPRCQLMR